MIVHGIQPLPPIYSLLTIFTNRTEISQISRIWTEVLECKQARWPLQGTRLILGCINWQILNIIKSAVGHWEAYCSLWDTVGHNCQLNRRDGITDRSLLCSWFQWLWSKQWECCSSDSTTDVLKPFQDLWYYFCFCFFFAGKGRASIWYFLSSFEGTDRLSNGTSKQ